MSAHRRPSRRALPRTGRGLVGLLAALLVLCGAGTASAYWTVAFSAGSGNALAQAASLSSPASPQAVQQSAGTVQVSWTAPGMQLSGARYVVTRTSGPGSPATVCTTTSATSCTDTGLAAGTAYAWTVAAVVLGTNWTTTPLSASLTTLGVTTTSLTGGNVGSAYSFTLGVTGGTSPFTWALTSGTLPAGLALGSGGVISGTPTSGGTFSGLVFTVTDSAGLTASSGALSLVIGKAAQTITVSTTPTSPAEAGTTYAPLATASSGLAVAITVDATSTGICTIASGVVTLRSIGTCTVDFDQAGDASYAAAPRKQQSITVVRGHQLVTSTIPTDAGVGGSLAVVLNSGLTPTLSLPTPSSGACSIVGTTITFAAAGQCVVNVTQAGDTNYYPLTTQISFLVSTPAGLGISITSSTGTTTLTCGTVTANRSCTVSGVGLSGSVTFNVVVLSSAGNRVVPSYTTAGTVTETGQDTGTASVAAGTSITTTTLTASHVGNATKTSTLTFGSFTLTLSVST